MQRRLTDDERKQAQQAYSGLYNLNWHVHGRVELAQKLLAMLKHDTTDGLPYVEPPLTDEDARARILVMCRDREAADWQGPHVFAAKGGHFFYAFISKGEVVRPWNHCRRATPAEIAAAGLETPDA
jgi:hypothetical protein